MNRPLLERIAVAYATQIEEQRALVELAKQMRAAQIRYFETRNRSDLVAAKELERNFDKAALTDEQKSTET